MRIYFDDKKTELKAVICNQCKKEMKVENGILKEGCMHGEIPFGYFSEKDGETHLFDLCEDCYDRMTQDFGIPVEKEERNELC